MKHEPFIKVFKGTEMPRGIRIFPWIIDNHSVLEYDKMVNKCLKALKNKDGEKKKVKKVKKNNKKQGKKH